jgi:hypothetical protein
MTTPDIEAVRKPARGCKPMPHALNEAISANLFELLDEPAKDQPVTVEFCGGDQSELRAAYAKAKDQSASGEPTGVEARVCELERQLTAVTEEREQMGKQAHANACEAMEYRRQRDAYAETLREIDRSGMVGNFIHKRHPELAGNSPALPPSVGSGESSTNQ